MTKESIKERIEWLKVDAQVFKNTKRSEKAKRQIAKYRYLLSKEKENDKQKAR